MISTNNKTRRGFTLVETLVAVSILAVAVAGAFSAAQGGISSSVLSKNQVIAFFLAQEGVEQIRNIRDENALNGRYWLTGIADNDSDPCYFEHVCTVDVLNLPHLSRCPSDTNSCPVLRQDTETGFYGHDISWSESPFKRTIEINPINANEVSILVTVSWSKGLVKRDFRVRENILNWQ